MSKVWKKIKLAVREFFNFLTNLMCPVISAILVLCELLQLPDSVIKTLKNVEHWFWAASGTEDAIKGFVDKVDDAIEKTEDSSEVLKK